MKYIALPDEQTRHLSFYLAMEEYVARHVAEPECFFLWQVAPSVIFGRNQVLENEVNVDYCRRHGIEIFRRKSGGGCVYADQSNLMLSFVTSDEHVGFAFNKFINMLLLVLRKMGIQAVCTQHNDVLLPPLSGATDDRPRKVSGTACYHLPGRSIVHGTLLYDTNEEHMQHAITPGPEKLQRKGIESVRQRITLLKDYTSLSLEQVKELIRTTLCEGPDCVYRLSTADVAAIEQKEQDYRQMVYD